MNRLEIAKKVREMIVKCDKSLTVKPQLQIEIAKALTERQTLKRILILLEE